MKLKAVGYFKEMLQGNESNPSIYDFIQLEANEYEEKMIEYLNSGVVIVACGGVVMDIINSDNGFAGCPDLKTDGIWAWSGDLAYYVKQYHLKLDEAFVMTMKKNNWCINDNIDIDFDDIEVV